jgi:allantoicase
MYDVHAFITKLANSSQFVDVGANRNGWEIRRNNCKGMWRGLQYGGVMVIYFIVFLSLL